MTRFETAQSTVATWLGLQPKSRWERLREMDWHDVVPSRQDIRGLLPRQQHRSVDFDTTSLVVGLVVGVSIGVGVGYALSRPTLKRARQQVREAIDRAEENLGDLPNRLNITRMEEQKTKK
jgi:hypothetical protein